MNASGQRSWLLSERVHVQWYLRFTWPLAVTYDRVLVLFGESVIGKNECCMNDHVSLGYDVGVGGTLNLGTGLTNRIAS